MNLNEDFKIRGFAFNSLKFFIIEKLGEKTYKEFLNNLPTNLMKFFSQEILEDEYYPIKDYFESIDCLCKIYKENIDELMFRIGEFSVKRAYEGPFKIIGDSLDFKSFINNVINFGFKFYYNFGNIKVKELDLEKGVAIFSINDFPFKDLKFEKRIEGGLYAIFEIKSLKNLKSQIIKSIAKGDDCIEIKISWHP
ncbi:MAG: heme NO-binding domain-containing protein [Candidatus Hydrothermales bacterium]